MLLIEVSMEFQSPSISDAIRSACSTDKEFKFRLRCYNDSSIDGV